MSRRRNRGRSSATTSGSPYRAPRSYSAPAPYAFIPLPARPSLYRTRAFALAPPVFAYPTVRSPLMRTVFSDTTRDRRSLWSPPSRRPSPSTLLRAQARMSTRNRIWPELSDEIPRPRALTCARRSIRREVLLALNSGNGAGSRNRPKSNVRC